MQTNSAAPDFGNVFVAMALVILPLATVAPLAIAWAALLPALWIAVIYLRCGQYPWQGRSWVIPASLAGLIVYGAVTSLWSISPDRTVHIALKLIPILAGGWLLVGAAAQLDERARQRTSTALLIGSAIALSLIAIEVATAGLIQGLLRGEGFKTTGNLYHLNRTASQLAILVWPLWLVLDRRFGPVAAAAGVGLGAIALFGLDPDTPLLTVLAGALFLLLAYLAPRIAQILMIAGVLVVAVAIPAYPIILPIIDNLLLSWNISDFTLRHRFAIWDFAAARTMEQPVLGWGLGASRMLPGADGIAAQLGPRAETLPLHPHNALLQIWLELGIPGILLSLVVVVSVLSKITRYIQGRKELATALTIIFSATLIAELSFGIWQSWWLVFLWVLAALTIAIAGGGPKTEPA
ncbi:MAG: O-antigen ligase family protein [Alphaproteobacteria bacterium]|nr:O-antigen ligase family protein [Alphaproteobacteria bacterium]